MPRHINKYLCSPARVAVLVAVFYLLASFFSVTIKRYQPLPGDAAVLYKRNQWAVVSTPRVLRGEEPHFLMMAHSLARDGDLFVSREYGDALRGGPQMGVYLRGRPAEYLNQHFSRNSRMTLIANHPPGLPAHLASLLWPLADSRWMEPATIWITALWGAGGVFIFLQVMRALGVAWPVARAAGLTLAFATPWFSYSRTLYTEVYLGTAFLAMLLALLRGRPLWAMPLCFAMAWFKYPALLLFGAGGFGAALSRRWRVAVAYGVAGVTAFLMVFMFNRVLFADAGWYTPVAGVAGHTPVKSVANLGAPIAWMPGNVIKNIERLFTDFDKGLFPHCPVALFALAGLGVMARQPASRRQFWQVMGCLLPWTAVHVCYRFFMSGDSYTTRYLVPMVPLAMVGLPWFWQWSRDSAGRRWWAWTGAAALGFSAVNNVIAGLFPGLSFDHTPLEIWSGFLRILWALK